MGRASGANNAAQRASGTGAVHGRRGRSGTPVVSKHRAIKDLEHGRVGSARTMLRGKTIAEVQDDHALNGLYENLVKAHVTKTGAQFRDVTSRSLTAIGLGPIFAERLLERDGIIHIVTQRRRVGPAEEHVKTACGQDLLESPMHPASDPVPRGGWKAAGAGTSPHEQCSGCQPFEAECGDCLEDGTESFSPTDTRERFSQQLAASLEAELREKNEGLWEEPLPDLEDELRGRYRRLLVNRSAAAMWMVGDLAAAEMMPDVYARTQRLLREAGWEHWRYPAGRLPEHIWSEVIGHVVEDFEAYPNDPTEGYRTLFLEIRGLLDDLVTLAESGETL